MRALPVVVLVVLAGCAAVGFPPATPDAGPAGTHGTPAADGSGTPGTAVGTPVTVVDVVDGDTVDVRYADGETDRVRLLGVDTPEVHDETDPTEFEGVPDTDSGAACLREAGEQAGDALRRWVAGESARVVVDETADRRDPYGRLLAYLVHEGVDLNRRLVARGHARVYDATFARADAYYEAEAEAQDANLGLWTCRNPGGA